MVQAEQAVDGSADVDLIPRYCDLPLLDGEHCSWGVFGPNDDFGTLNHLTSDRVAAAALEVRDGTRIGLQLPPHMPSPPLYGRDETIHELFQTGRNTWDDRLDRFYPQQATQWDGFRHIRYREHGFYGGLTDDPPRLGDRLSIHHWAEAGIIGRGLLLDIARHLQREDPNYDAFSDRIVTADDLIRCLGAQQAEVRPGDVLCLRFGWADRYKGAADADRQRFALVDDTRPSFAGISPARDVVELLWDWRVSAIAADNPAVEVSPGSPELGSFHRRALALLGFVLGELFDFDELAEQCASDGRWGFLFASVPLAIRGGVGSPANAVAVR